MANSDRTDKFFLSDSFDIKGFWYLPSQDAIKDGIPGILHYTPKMISLDLIGTLNGRGFFDANDNEKPITIYGFSNRGEKFSLIGCYPFNGNISAPGFETISYAVHKFYSGDFIVEDENDCIIKAAKVRFANIDAWLRYNNLSQKIIPEEKKYEIIINLDSAFLSKKNIFIKHNSLCINEELEYKYDNPKEFFLDETTKIILKRFYWIYTSNQSLIAPNALFDFAQTLRKLLVLLIGKPIYFSYLEFYLPDGSEIIDGKQIKISRKCRLFFNQVGEMNRLKKISPNNNTILISRKDIDSDIEDIFNYWFREQEKLQEITGTYINNLYSPTYAEPLFLNTVRGIEAYHRFYCKPDPVKTEYEDALEKERKKLIEFINTSISKENRDYFVERINYCDEISLRKRITYLLNELPQELRDRIWGKLNATKTKSVVTKIIDTRNYFTHRDSLSKYPNAVTDVHSLAELYRRLSIVLQYYSLCAIGVDPDIVKVRLIQHLNF